MLRCTHCDGTLTIEPARLRCSACGRQVERERTSALDRRRQIVMDACYLNPGAAAKIVLGFVIGLEEMAQQRT